MIGQGSGDRCNQFNFKKEVSLKLCIILSLLLLIHESSKWWSKNISLNTLIVWYISTQFLLLYKLKVLSFVKLFLFKKHFKANFVNCKLYYSMCINILRTYSHLADFKILKFLQFAFYQQVYSLVLQVIQKLVIHQANSATRLQILVPHLM